MNYFLLIKLQNKAFNAKAYFWPENIVFSENVLFRKFSDPNPGHGLSQLLLIVNYWATGPGLWLSEYVLYVLTKPY